MALSPQERRFIDEVRDEIDQLTPNVDGLTRTQILTLSACSYFTGAADATDHAVQIGLTGDMAAGVVAAYRKIAAALVDGAA